MRWVQCMLHDKMMQSRNTITRNYQAIMNVDFKTLVGHAVTRNELWLSCYYYSVGNRQGMHWKFAGFATTSKFKVQALCGNALCPIICGMRRICCYLITMRIRQL